jgi:predicted CopG family antitoxin
MGTHTQTMSKNIAISDEVYRRLKREKGDRSFSDLIADTLDEGGQLADVTGQQVLEPETYTEVDAEIGRLSDGTRERLIDRKRE